MGVGSSLDNTRRLFDVEAQLGVVPTQWQRQQLIDQLPAIGFLQIGEIERTAQRLAPSTRWSAPFSRKGLTIRRGR